MKILIAGSSGLIGTALIESLNQKGNNVVGLLRNPAESASVAQSSPAESASVANSEHLIWNPPEKGIDLTDQNFDVIINLCGEPVSGKKWNEEQKRLLYQSRIVSTRLLTSAIASMKTPPKLFLNASAIGVYGERGNRLLTEAFDIHSPIRRKRNRAGTFMLDLCKDWEATAQLAAESGTPTFALRIGLIVDKKARFFKLQKPFFKLGLGGWLGNPNSWISWVSLDDTIRSIAFIIENSQKILHQNLPENEAPKMFRAINLTAPNPATAKDFAKALGKSLKRPVIFRIPKRIPKMMLGKELINSLLQSARVAPKELIDAGFDFKHPTALEAFKEASLKKKGALKFPAA